MITNFNTNFLLVWIFRVNCGQSGHGQSGQTRNLMRKKVLKIVYINNILFIYTIFRREKYFQKSSLTTLTMTTLTTFVLFPKVTMQSNRYNTQKSKFSYSTHTQQLTALFLVIFDLLCLTSHSTNEQTAEKCRIFAEEKQHSAI